VRQTFFR